MNQLSVRCLVAVLVFLLSTLAFHPVTAQDKKDSNLDQSEELMQKYLEAFKKSGVPTPKAVDAALQRARQAKSIESWVQAARIANTYANVVDVLTSHYSQLYYASRSAGSGGDYSLINKAAAYERVRNRYLMMRNDAYIELAKLYLAKGDAAAALSYVTSAVKLSAAEPNVAGEALIKQIVQYGD